LKPATPIVPNPGVFETIRSDAKELFEPLLTAEEAAEHLRIHVKTLQRLAREQRVPCVRMGKYWRFRLSTLDHWVTTQQNQTSQPFRVSDEEKHLEIHA
jgi:excisionase family DNA binding protein